MKPTNEGRMSENSDAGDWRERQGRTFLQSEQSQSQMDEGRQQTERGFLIARCVHVANGLTCRGRYVDHLRIS